MKLLFKKALSFCLALALAVGAGIVAKQGGITASALTTDELINGETVEFGSYPKSNVTDETLLAKLNSLSLTWTYYDYYAGTSTQHPNQSVIGSMKQLDFMKFCDVELDGEKYRAVYMEKYRPNNTTLVSSADNSLIDNYGYKLKTVYWFKYEPVIWTVLDAENGIMITTNSIDAQPFNNNQYSKNDLIYSDKYTNFADDYSTSSIREWLNNEFFRTAFSAEDINSMLKTDVVTDSKTTNDYVYLLSADEVANPAYGFDADSTAKDTARRANASDYAFSQGVINQTYGTNWFTRSTGNSAFGHGAVTAVNNAGNLNANFSVSACTLGIRPVIKIKPAEAVPEKTYTLSLNADGGIFSDGTEELIFEYKAGETIGEIEIPEKEGYVFASWNEYLPSVMPENDLTVDAVWIPATDTEYAVETYTMNTEGTYDKTSKTLTGTTDAMVDAAFEIPEGFSFNSEKSKLSGTVFPDGSLVLKVYLDRNKYTLTTVADGVSKETEYYFGEEIAEIPSPQKAHYAFKGWECSVPDTMPAKSITLTALFEPIVYTVNFVANGSTVAAEEYTVENTAITEPCVPQKAGHTGAWEAYELCGNNITVNAIYTADEYTVTWVVDGAETIETFLYGTEIKTPAIPVKAGYIFAGWTPQIPETMPAENITVTAVFEMSYICPDCGDEILGANAINTHIAAEARMKATVRIRNNNGSTTVKYGETLKLTAVVTDKPADAKIYWYVDGIKNGEGETFESSPEGGSVEVTVKLVDSSGNIIRNAGGKEISDSEKVTVNSGFWQRIIAFFRKLFKLEKTIIQAINL